MPRAIVTLEDTERLDLKSCPEGYVVLRRLTYGQMLERRAMTKMEFTGGGKKDISGQMALANAAVQLYEYKHCVVEHNLTDENDRQLNFGSAIDVARLDPRIGTEIEVKIGEMNNYEEDESSGN